MNTEKVQAEINVIITSIKAKGWKLTKTTKKALKEAEELGLILYLGIYAREDVKGAEIVKAIIDAAKDAGGKIITESSWTAYGDGEVSTYVTEASALYLALHDENEPEETPQTEQAAVSPWGEWKPECEGDIYCKQRADVAPYTYERVTVINGKVAHSEMICLGAAWKDGDPYANHWQDSTVADLKAAGFEAHFTALQNWLASWGRMYSGA